MSPDIQKYIGFAIFALAVIFGDKLLPYIAGLLQKGYSGLKSLGGSAAAKTDSDALPSFTEAMAAMQVIATYKAKCQADAGYAMAIAALKSLEAM